MLEAAQRGRANWNDMVREENPLARRLEGIPMEEGVNIKSPNQENVVKEVTAEHARTLTQMAKDRARVDAVNNLLIMIRQTALKGYNRGLFSIHYNTIDTIKLVEQELINKGFLVSHTETTEILSDETKNVSNFDISW